MDENSGAISVLSALDKEIQSEYELIIKASDTGMIEIQRWNNLCCS